MQASITERRAPAFASPACLTGVLALVLGACSPDPPAVDGGNDAAGITPSAGTEWTLASRPSTTIGASDGDEALFGVAGAVRLSSGQIIVAEGSRLLVFDEEGTRLRTIGRSGQGPGEFGRISWVRRLTGDSVLVHDAALGRSTIFTPDGEVAVETHFRGAPAPRVVGRFTDGRFLSREFAPSPDEPETGISSYTSTLLLHDTAGAVVTSIATFDGGLLYKPRRDGPRITRGFLPTTLAAAGHQAVFVSTSLGEVVRIDLGGGRLSLVGQPAVRGSVAEADVRRWLPEPLQEPTLREFPEGVPLPIYSEILVDGEGLVWLEEYPGRRDDSRRWRVLGPDGKQLGHVEVPGPFLVTDTGANHVLGVWTDTLDVEYVHVYRLSRGERPSESTVTSGM